MIEDSVKIHDDFSIEIKSIYENIFKRKKTKYDTITYLFIPNGLHINEQTYTKSKFYNDVKVYVRYNASQYNLVEILEVETSPLNLLKNTIKKLSKGKVSQKESLEFKSSVKMLCVILNETLRIETKLLKNKLKSDGVIFASEYLKRLQEVLTIYRDFIFKIEKTKLKKSSKIVLKYGDEYISNFTNYYLIQLYDYISNLKVEKEKIKEIVQFISKEKKYRKVNNYDVDIEYDFFDETLLYKRSQLKKYIEGVLFLNRDVRKDGAFFEQSVFALAAGIAMVFSTGIAFYYQLVYGNFTLPFFIALVVGYMFKDRIKWLIGLLFISKANSLFYDYKVKIKDSKNNIIGKIKENFSFVPFHKLGQKVKAHRFKDSLFSEDYDLNGEHIVQYKKKIVIYPKKFGNEISDNRLNSLVDITRINFYRFISQMDDPKKEYSLLKKGEIITRVGNKVYHINVVQKLYTEKGIEFKRYRIVMNRKGIKRIDKVKINQLN
jgi:hypothetical protein